MSGFRYTIKELEAEAEMDEYRRSCVDVPKFLAFCEACHNYGGAWSCPPFDFNPMERWRRYGRMRLYARMLIPTEPGQAAEAALQALQEEKDAHLERLLEWEAATPSSLALAAGSCTLCTPCARKEGHPCQKPEQMRYSIEALGGDVGLTASRYLGKPLLWIRDGVVPEYLMLVGALLLPDGEG
ncbi:conserved hypothetical protein [uncultured Eubacteriales bacterium]|uniref:Metal-binding protein n=1 Tax=uncultured Eubacteriales bacterium TaxID=172733 RepID=A0A212KJ68_9FIRM|nr:conserved hypothetical protein [uncultured Eubacteriales bacterium]